MITFTLKHGRLGNIIYSINTVFSYCNKYHIDYKNICFCSDYFGTNKCSSKYLDNILYNIKKFFYPVDVYREYIKNNKRIVYDKCKEYSTDINFIGFSWDKNINLNVFYNKEIFENTIKKLRILYPDYRDRIALHIRRTDFKKYHYGKHLQKKEDILKKIQNDKKYYIFSDDVKWCRENINNKNCIIIDNIRDWESMILMMYCRDVIPNEYSSFSNISKKINVLLNENNLII